MHRLVVAGIDTNRDVIQETYSWSTGAPNDVMIDSIGNNSSSNIIIISETSPDAVVFTSQPPGSGGSFPFTGPSFFEIGLGAIEAVPSISGMLGENLLYIADGTNNEVRAYRPVE